MAIKSSSFTLAAALSAILLISGCQTRPSKPETTVPTAPAKGGPFTPTPTVPQEAASVPSRQEVKRVAVILGPGGAKTFAHVGVLKALQQQRIPIEKVVGLEWGSLMGALFANKGQVNDMEWKLYKMEQQHLPRPTGFFSRRNDETIKVMDGFLDDAFGRDDIGRSKITYGCPSRSLYTGVVSWQNRGLYKDALKRCMGYPPLFKVQGSFMAGASQATEAIEQLAREGFNIIVLVNVLGSAMPVAQDALLDNVNNVILWQEVKRAITEASRLNVETISVDTSAFPIMQFEAKKDLIQLGEAAGTKAASGLISKYGF
ncbi:MAG: hypothetical protein KF799_01625 [Bdellovibrionales bacterium]|nr:hypothetical protein [Bdellovibrionales bacterium]